MIMAFMGDHQLKQPLENNLILRAIVEKGIHLPVVRDEIYCQIMKQTISNPKKYSFF